MGSGRLRAVQIRDELLRRNYESRIVADCTEVKNSILIYIKGANIDRAKIARDNGNIVVVDLIDPHQKHCFRIVDPESNRAQRYFLHELPPELFDGVIFVNSYVRNQYQDYGDNLHKVVLLHPWDNRFKQPGNFDHFSLASLGHSSDQVAIPEYQNFNLPNHVLTEAMIHGFQQYSCHLSVRQTEGGVSMEKFGDPTSRFSSKSNIKVSIAAACGANIICSADPGSREVLPASYPFWYDATKPLIDYIADVKSMYGNAEWRTGLEMMKEVREMTSTAAVVDQYEKYLQLF